MAFSSKEALARLEKVQRAGRLAHAYLVTGDGAVAVNEFASELSARILKTSKERVAHHPDFHTIHAESKTRKITVEQMREIEKVIYQRASAGERKVAVIYDADRLGVEASNAFLKTLEEPPEGTHLLLVSGFPEAILPTILSRCVEIALRSEGEEHEWSEREKEARDIVRLLLNEAEPCGLSEVFLGVQRVQAILAEIKVETEKDALAKLKEIKAQYRDKTSVKAEWFDEQEERLNAMARGRLAVERARLLDAMASILSERLLAASASGDIRIHHKLSLRLLRQIDGIHDLRSCLEKNVNEALAIESVFVEIFSRP